MAEAAVAEAEVAEKGVAAKVWGDASGMLGGALGVSLFADQSFLELAAIIGSVVAYATAVLLFAQLLGAGDLPGREVPAWFDKALSVLLGAGVGAGLAYTNAGVAFAVSLAVLAALIQTAWRQRWRESQVYRASLNASPDDGAGHENA